MIEEGRVMLGKTRVLAFVGILSLFLLFTVLPTAHAYQADVSVTLDFDMQEVDTRPGTSGIIEFTGTVNCDMYGMPINGQSVVVTLEAWVESQSWPAAVTPSEIRFNSSGDQPFHVSVKVPSGSTAGNHTITVGGTYAMDPGAPLTYQIQSASATIRIKQYFDIETSMKPTSLQVRYGQRVGANLSATNTGNGDDKLEISMVSGKQELEKAGCNVVISPAQLDIDQNSTGSFEVSITSSTPISNNAQVSLILRVTSAKAKTQGTAGYDKTVTLSLKIISSLSSSEDDSASDEDTGNSTKEEIPVETIYLSDICCEVMVPIIVLIIIFLVLFVAVRLRRGSTYGGGYGRSSYRHHDHGLFDLDQYHSHNSHHSYSSGHSSHHSFSGPHTHEIKLFRR